MRWKSAIATLALLGAVLVANPPPLLAQAVQTSTLSGTIKDGSGAVLPGATVNVSSPSQVGGVQTSITDSQGVYRFPALHPGVYELEAALSGFRTVKRSDITLTLGTTTTIDVAQSLCMRRSLSHSRAEHHRDDEIRKMGCSGAISRRSSSEASAPTPSKKAPTSQAHFFR